MMGAWTVEVRAVKPFAIHGDLYYELHVIRTDVPADTMTALRVPQHATAGEKTTSGGGSRRRTLPAAARRSTPSAIPCPDRHAD